MRLFDTHCHFETTDRTAIAAVLERARTAGVERVLAVGGSEALNAAATVAGELGCALALGHDRDQISEVRLPIPEAAPLCAWGEIGLDYHYSPETRRQQCELFAAELEEARHRDLPVIIHTREADDDTLAILREVPSRGVIHSFSGSPTFARELLDLGFFISFSGIVTFRAADNVRESAAIVPDDRILIETDSPYLAPVPMRGQANEPAFVRHTCEFLAKFRNVAVEDFAELTFLNGEGLFGEN